MFQKELGDKILGIILSYHYGRLSIIRNYKLKPINNFFVSPNCFSPKPKVTSTVIHFQPKKIENIKIKKNVQFRKNNKYTFFQQKEND